jgi:glycosyltransferase involved in cell wall biosynthesis
MPAVPPIFNDDRLRTPQCGRPKILLGITNAQTCLVLGGRPRTLREAGFDVTIVSSPGVLLDELARSEGVKTIAISMERQPAPLRDLISFVKLWLLLRKIRPDTVEFSTPKAGLLGMLAAWCARVPHRVYLLRGLKLETAVGWKRRMLWAAEWTAAACSHVALCTSASLQLNAAALRIAPPEKLRLLGEGSSVGVDTRRFSPGSSDVRETSGIPRGSLVLGFVGRLTHDKGLPELITAFEVLLFAYPEARLLLVGWFDEAEDSLDVQMRERILLHPRMICTGFVSDTAPYYRAMDILILPTLREGFPNAVLEASASGVPVITTLSTGARDAVVPGVTGLLVPPGNADAIVEAAARLMGDAGSRRRMGRAGREWVLQHFDREGVLRENVEFYRDLFKQGPSSGHQLKD